MGDSTIRVQPFPSVAIQITGPSDIDILEGNDATLECVITGLSSPNAVSWSIVGSPNLRIFTVYPNGMVAHAADYDANKHSDWSIDQSRTNHYDLIIPDVNIDDDGIYDCGLNIDTPGTIASHYGTLSVTVPVTSVSIDGYSTGTTVYIIHGSESSFTCRVIGTKPSADIDWFIGTQLYQGTLSVENDGKLRDTTSVFTFTPNLDNDDDKQLQCKASNTDERSPVTTYVTLYVKVAIPSNPMISDASSDYSTGSTVIVTSGNSYTFTCTAGESRPEPTITWYLGSTEKTGNQPSVIPNGKLSTTVRSLTFTPQWTDHDEQLQCRAENDVTPQYKQTHIMLDVYVGPTIPTISGSNAITAGTSATFTCFTTSRPESILTWYINNTPQSINNNTPQNNNGLIIASSDLMFTSNLDNHNGKNLKCKADNEADTSAKEKEITLEVQVIPSNIEISSVSTGKLIVYNNIESTITCTSIGGKPAATIQWYINNSPATHDNVQTPDNQQDNRLKDTISTLVLTPIYTEHHNKTLKCEATNDATDRDQPINEQVLLDVWISPDQVNIDGYSTNDNVTMRAGVEYQLDCTASKAHPPASIEWYKDDVDITTGSNSRIVWDHDGKMDTISRLSITPIKEDFGKRIGCESNHDAQSMTQHTFVNMIVQFTLQQ
ncbi:synaptogenesis protein syg-2-like [Saccoglossus kowalevskii]